MNNYIRSFNILRGLENNPVINSLCNFYTDNTLNSRYDFLNAVYSADAQDGIVSYIQNCILYDVNVFSENCAKSGNVSERLKKAFCYDLAKIKSLIDTTASFSELGVGDTLPQFVGTTEEVADNLADFYYKNGCGKFAKYSAFIYRNGDLVPVKSVATKRLDELKNYQTEKTAVINNVKDFINDLPFSNMLLYGDRGTGKSSTVHAVLNEFSSLGLRLIELNKADLEHITEIREAVALQPLKFIIFIDDLSFEGNDKSISALKASLEGTILGSTNTMIVATSNRRHIVNESFSDRQNSVHPSDLAEEQLSLSDRFGLTVIFSSTDKVAYLSIVNQLAEDKKLQTPKENLDMLAERWAIVKGGRSPRRAEQFINLAYSCEKSGRDIEF
ncbi:MAG: ATP-binding protein [Candidatus Coproplasma sp.]